MKRKAIFLCLILCCIAVLSSCYGGSRIDDVSKNLSLYNIVANYNDEDKTVAGELSLEFVNNFSSPVDEIVFHLWANAFAENVKHKPVSSDKIKRAYPNGINYGNITVLDFFINNKSVNPVVTGEDNTILVADFEHEVPVNGKASVRLNFVSQLPEINHRYGYGKNTVNLTGFFPILSMFGEEGWDMNPYSQNGDPFYTEIANFDVTLTFPKNFTLASTGTQVKCTETTLKKEIKTEAKAVRDYAMVLSTEFQVKEAEVNETQILYYYFKDDSPESSLQTCIDVLTTFNRLFGDYPYEQLSVVQANFVHGGMEFPSLVMISDDLESKEEHHQVIIHEIAHQWWYGLVGNNSFVHGWIDEGLAEFSTLLFYKNNPNYGVDKDKQIDNITSSYALFEKVYREIYGSVDTTMNRKLNDYLTEPEYVYMAYVKSTLLYDSLYNLLGEAKFLKCLQNLVSKNFLKNITPEILVNEFELTAKTDLKSFFDSWINGKVVIINN